MNSTKPFVEVKNVSKSFGSNEVLRSLDLTVQVHEVVCVIGPSGCGKSTLLRCIDALEPIDDGMIIVGEVVASHPAVDVNHLRRFVGIVFQSYNLFPHLSVMDNLCLGPVKVLREPKEVARERARSLLEQVGLPEKADAYPEALSGGQQQRVAIARALAMKPDLLLLDEVTAALDPELVDEVLSILSDLAEAGMTMIIATHEMAFARDVADRVCFLSDGSIYEEGPAESFFARPQKPRTQSFLKRITDAGRL
ncbi:MAG TPA: amino acid ABC transporter ATP-binding protein [Actinobacteria bacterium]|nr:amino acid ABC transporter ATP-binding protein [Actinomycetota bacterium]